MLEGRAAAGEGNWQLAIDHFTKSIGFVRSDPLLFIERAGIPILKLSNLCYYYYHKINNLFPCEEAYMSVQEFDLCIKDCEKALQMLRGPSDNEHRARYVTGPFLS